MATTHILKPTISVSPSSHFAPSTISLPFPCRTQSYSHFFISIPSRIHSRHTPLPTLSRRLFLPSVSGIWDALTGGNNAREAIVAIRRGMLLFRQGDVPGSLVEFDKAIELDPRQKAYLWQRGLSLYYLDRLEEGAEQFRLDVAQNPNDTEESIWCFLCEAQLYGVNEARKRFLEVGEDPRPVMREAYNMFKMVANLKSLLLHFRMDGRMRFSMLLYMLGFILNLRTKLMQPSFMYLLHANLLMDRGLRIIWSHLQGFIVFIEIGACNRLFFCTC